MKIVFLKTVIVACVVLFPAYGSAQTILDTATGDRLSNGTTANDDFFTGHSFNLAQATRIDEVGADFSLFSSVDGPAFFAFHELSSLNDLPNNSDLTGSDLLFTGVFTTPGGTNGVLLTPVTGLTLGPGDYSLTFGANAFGAGTNTGLGLAGYTIDLAPDQDTFTAIQSNGSFVSQSSNNRFIINGVAVPEPSSFAVLFCATIYGLKLRLRG